MTTSPWQVRAVTGTELRDGHAFFGCEQSITITPLDVTLPFVGVGVPMGLLKCTGFQLQKHRGHCRRHGKLARRCDVDGAAVRTRVRWLSHETEAVRARGIKHFFGPRLRTVEGDDLALHDVGLAARNLEHAAFRRSEGAVEQCSIEAAHPIADAERTVLGIKSVVESEYGVERLSAKGRDGVTVTLGKIPQVAWAIVDHFGLARRVDDCDLALAAQHECPLGRIVPVHLARAAWINEQMRAGDSGCQRQTPCRDLAGPAARGRLDRRFVERGGEYDRIAAF